jgi:phage gp36-like protein
MYITNADIETRLGPALYVQLTDDSGAGVANEDVVNEARLAAEGEVDAYLAARYQVPIDIAVHPQVAGVLVGIALDLAEYRLRARRPPIPADAGAKHGAAIEWLRRVARGEVELPAAEALASNPATAPHVLTTGEKRVLTREELSGF